MNMQICQNEPTAFLHLLSVAGQKKHYDDNLNNEIEMNIINSDTKNTNGKH